MRFCKLPSISLLSYFGVAVLLGVAVGNVEVAVGQEIYTNHIAQPNSRQRTSLMFTTKAYDNEALRLVLQEANQVAQALQLPEKLPITKTNLVQYYISPYGMARVRKSIGNVTTRNYTYYVSIDRKFSFLEETHQEEDCRRWYKQYSWPVSRMDTNAAYQLAKHWLEAASMDVNALNMDCKLHIYPMALTGQGASAHFSPVYWVYWTKGAEEQGSVAAVELFTPTKKLMQLRVHDSKYILRKPLVFTNIDYLLSQTNAPIVRKNVSFPFQQ